MPGLVEFHNPEGARIGHGVSEHHRAALLLHLASGAHKRGGQVLAVEHVVSEHKGHVVIADEITADDEGLGQAVGMLLHRIGQFHAQIGSVAEQLLEAADVLRRGNDEHLADARQHEHA